MAAPIVYTDYDSEAENIARRQKYAEALRDQASQALPTGQMVGNRVVPISWTQGLAQVLKGYAGHKMSEKASADRTALAGKRNAALAEVLGGMPKARNVALPTDQEGTGSFDMSGTAGPQQKLEAPSMQENAAWLGKAAGLGGNAPALATSMLGMQQKADENEANRQSRTMDRIMQLESAAANLAASREERAARAREANELRRELADQADARARDLAKSQGELRRDLAAQSAAVRREISGAGKVPPGYRVKPDGTMEAIPGGPADAKTQKANETVEGGRGTVSSLVATLRDAYDQLDKSGGITNPEAGTIRNIGAGVASSGPGQFLGRITGTQNQSLRNQIAQQRPLLLNAIKNATGMSAKQMDSNAELKLYLSAATDPTLDVKANRAALDKLDELYGLSGKKPAAPAGGVIDFNSLQ